MTDTSSETEEELFPTGEIAEGETTAAGSGNEAADVEDEVEFADEVEDEEAPYESPYDRPGAWYVIHTYAGYENKVKSNLESMVASLNLEDRVFEVVIPMEDV